MVSFVYMVCNNDEYALPFACSCSPKELASMIGVNVMTVYRWINDCIILNECEIVVHCGKWLFSVSRLCSSPPPGRNVRRGERSNRLPLG